MSNDSGQQKNLFVGDKVVSINLKKKTVTFCFKSGFKDVQADGEQLLNDLIEQQMNFFTHVPVRGLSLTWSRHEKKENDAE